MPKKITSTQPPKLPSLRGGTDKPCENCLGTGREQDQARLGETLKKRRAALNLSLTSVADAMGLSQGYLSDLERGRRHWTIELVQKYLGILKDTALPNPPNKARH